MLKRTVLVLLVLSQSSLGRSAPDQPPWPVVSHLNEWRQFVAAGQQEGAWPAFERHCFRPNAQLLSGFLSNIGIHDPIGFLKQEIRKLDPATPGFVISPEAEAHLVALIESASRDTLRLLPGANRLSGRIHIWCFFSVFDGMGMVIENGPTVMLDASALAQASDNAIRVLTAHEIHHAVRSGVLGSHIPTGGIFEARAGDHMVAEGLAVAFSEVVYPGLELREYFPAYTLHPEKMDAAVRQQNAIQAALLAAADRPIADPTVAGYFYGSSPDDDRSPVRNSAYLVGYRIVRALMRHGTTLDQLTRMPAADILKLDR